MRTSLLITLSAAALFASAPAISADPPPSEPGEARLEVTKSEGGALLLAWDESNSAESTDPAIYEGSLLELRRGHWDLEPVDCSGGNDRREEILPTPGSRYYLLVPRPASRRFTIKRGSKTIESRWRPTPCALRR